MVTEGSIGTIFYPLEDGISKAKIKSLINISNKTKTPVLFSKSTYPPLLSRLCGAPDSAGHLGLARTQSYPLCLDKRLRITVQHGCHVTCKFMDHAHIASGHPDADRNPRTHTSKQKHTSFALTHCTAVPEVL